MRLKVFSRTYSFCLVESRPTHMALHKKMRWSVSTASAATRCCVFNYLIDWLPIRETRGSRAQHPVASLAVLYGHPHSRKDGLMGRVWADTFRSCQPPIYDPAA